MPMREAVARFVPDGASVCMGAALEALIPFAAGHEIIRQRRRDLTLIGPISDMLFDQLVGAGAVRRIIAAWVGNVSAGLGHNYRRAVEQGIPAAVEVQDHSNLTLAFALHAAALGVPYLLTPELKVVAVVHEPYGAFPSPVQGCYGRHHDFYHRFHEESRTAEGNRAWLDRWIHGVSDWKGFLGLLGPEALETIRIRRHLPSEPLDYGA